MNVNALTTSTHGPAKSINAAKTAFADLLSKASQPTQDDALRKQSEQLVNGLFMGTMLKQMRSSAFHDSTFSGGRAGEAYAGLFDQHLTAKAGGGMAGKLVDVMVRHFRRGQDAATRDKQQEQSPRNPRKPSDRGDLNAATLALRQQAARSYAGATASKTASPIGGAR